MALVLSRARFSSPYLLAVQTRLQALHGKTSAADARAALIRAAEEAGIPVITVVH
ncbi:DUF982 domain-containing protein [Rhizobium sp. P32RR-XVIII]|nr:DUF982 domain-containing protein [Rhizobium sp. P32RR-XVIII]